MNLQKYDGPHPSLAFKLKHEFARPLNYRLRQRAARAEWIARLLRPALGSLLNGGITAKDSDSFSPFISFAANEG